MAQVSKNSRASRGGGKAKGQGAVRLLIPVGGGQGVYLFDPQTGRNPRYRVGSEEFVAAVAEIAGQGLGATVSAEIDALHDTHPLHGWDRTKRQLIRAGALTA